MNLKPLNITFLILLILSVILLPFLMGASIIGLSEQENFVDEDDFLMMNYFSATWMTMPLHQMTVLSGLVISIFVLVIVYLGGRSKHRRFNDRTIDAINVLKAELLKTARIRAVFNFYFLDPNPQEVRSNVCR
jgi:hypothetical protein